MSNVRSLGSVEGRASHKNNFGMVRLYLAVSVALGHYAWVFPHGIVPPHLAEWLVGEDGLNGVRAFFIISGYFLFKSFRNSSSLFSYVKKRANRVLPAYITVIVGATILGFFIGTETARDYLSLDLLKYVFWNLLFLNFIHPTLPGVFQDQPIHLVNSSLWTLKIEVGFYLSVPVIVAFSRWVRLPVLLVILYAMSIIYENIFNHLFHVTSRPIFHTLAMQMPGQLCYFLSGALIEYHRETFSRHARIFCFGAVLMILLSYALSVDALYPISFGILVIAICTLAPYFGNWEKFGDFSYSIYIFHFPILQTFCALGLFSEEPTLQFLVVFSTIIAVAVVSWNLIEVRFLRSGTARLADPGGALLASPHSHSGGLDIPDTGKLAATD